MKLQSEILLLYAVADMLDIHFEDIYKKNTITKGNKLLKKDFNKILNILSSFNEEELSYIRERYIKLLDEVEQEYKELFNAFSPVLVAIALLSNYSLNPLDKRIFKIHKNRVEKILSLLKRDAGFRHLDKFALNSYKIGDLIYEKITKKGDKNGFNKDDCRLAKGKIT